MPPLIKTKRVYLDASKDDGYRILIDRLWPRGISKENLHANEWIKDMAPSAELRKWYDHDPIKWIEFKKRYSEELKHNELIPEFITNHKHLPIITLLFAAKAEDICNAVVLKDFLQKQFAKK